MKKLKISSLKLLLKYHLPVFILLFYSCSNDGEEFAAKWTNDIKRKIMEDAGQPSDSVSKTVMNDSIQRVALYQNHFLLKDIRINIKTADTLSIGFYSKDQNFILGREYCSLLQNQSVELILYKNLTVGLHEFFHCNGKLKKSGLNVGGYIGIWREFDEFGNEIKEVNYGKLEKADTLKKIKYYR
jgi:antitoxin component YwqK of YwqJK toxin-antitoxin module